MIRVLGGTAKGRKLQGPKGTAFRPATGQVKTFIFSYVGPDIEGARILDLFSGSGSLGIEALSRGAGAAMFIENSQPQVRMIRENLRLCGFEHSANVLFGDVFSKMADLHRAGEEFDYIFADPPFRESLHARIVETAGKYPLLERGGELFIEHEVHDRTNDVRELLKHRERAFGQSVISIYRPKPNE